MMDIAVTGGSGRLGRAVTIQLLEQGHKVRSLDWTQENQPVFPDKPFVFKVIDLKNLQAFTEAIQGCDAVIHLAAILNPENFPPGVGYINNTIISYNALYAASSLGIQRLSLASSINALGGARSPIGRYDYLPVDENHPTFNDDDYALSKWVLEQQADSFARRFPKMTISSLRFHALPDDPPVLDSTPGSATGVGRTLWGWTLMSEAARACVLAVTQASYTGHEVFFITAQTTSSSLPSLELARQAYPNVPIRADLSGRKSLYDCSKAARLLGWTHQDY
jgi:nucleoside-diphosphate-sugar epimerase